MAEFIAPASHDSQVERQLRDPDATNGVMRTRFLQAQAAEDKTRVAELDDLRFSHGDQWPGDILIRRQQDRRPMITINQAPQFVRQITNEERQARMAIRIRPADGTANKDTAKILQGMIRHIEVDSDADVAYETAGEAAARGGKGYFRILTEYADAMSFNKVAKIRRIRNRFTVYLDPAYQQFDASDANWGMIIEQMNREEFMDRYPDGIPSPMADYTSTGDGWIDTDEVRVAEYFWIEREEKSLSLLSDGSIVEGELPDLDGRSVVKRRRSLERQCWWVKSNGYQILEGPTRFPAPYIPIIPVVGDEADVNGEVSYSGIVRHSKDPGRMVNYYASNEAETIALAPRTPWIGPVGTFESQKTMWAQANERNFPTLEYNPVYDREGRPLPGPERAQFEPPIAALTQARILAQQSLHSTTGIHPPSLGQPSGEQSGRAIIARQSEGDTATFHYPSNLARALRHAGRVLLHVIRELYTQEQVVQIVGDDDEVQQVTVNGTHIDEMGMSHTYNVGAGRYDAVVDVGPAYKTKREEAATAQLELTKIFPPLFERAGHIMVKNMDWPGAEEIAELIKPPDQRSADGDVSPREELINLRAMVPQLQQEAQALNEYAKQCEQKLTEVEQQNAEMSVAAHSKEGELQVKQAEAASKAATDQQRVGLEQAKLVLEERKLELDEQKLALEVAKTQTDIGEAHQRIAATMDQQSAMQNIEANVQQGQSVLIDALQALQTAVQDLHETMQAEHDARMAPKTVSMSRENGVLVGTVSSNGSDARTIEVRPTDEGYEGTIG